MNTDEAWESFIGIRKSSVQGYQDTIAASLNEIQTNTANLMKLTNRLLGDQGMLEDSAGSGAQSPADDLSGFQNVGGNEMAQEDINEDRNALDEALGVIDEQVGGGAMPPAPQEGGPEEQEPAPEMQEGMGVPMDGGLPKPEANFATECIQFSERLKKELQDAASQGDYYKARRLIEIVTAIDKIIDSDGDPSTVLKSGSMEKSKDNPNGEIRAMRTPMGRARASEGVKGVVSDKAPEDSRIWTKDDLNDRGNANVGQQQSDKIGEARGDLNPGNVNATPTGRMSRAEHINRSGDEFIPDSDWRMGDEHDMHSGIEHLNKSEEAMSKAEYDPMRDPAPLYENYSRQEIIDRNPMRYEDGIWHRRPVDAMRTPEGRERTTRETEGGFGGLGRTSKLFKDPPIPDVFASSEAQDSKAKMKGTPEKANVTPFGRANKQAMGDGDLFWNGVDRFGDEPIDYDDPDNDALDQHTKDKATYAGSDATYFKSESIGKAEDKYDIYDDYPNADQWGFDREMDGSIEDVMRTPYAVSRGNSRMPYNDETSGDRWRVSYERDARMGEPENIVGDGAVEENMVTPGHRALHGPNGGDRLSDPVQDEAEGAFLKSSDGQTADPMPISRTNSSEGGRKKMPMPDVDMTKTEGEGEEGGAEPVADQGMSEDGGVSVASSCGKVKKSIPTIRELMEHRQGGEADPYAEFAKAYRHNLQYDIDHNEQFQKSTAKRPDSFADLMAKYRKVE